MTNCFEGTACGWPVAGGGYVSVFLSPEYGHVEEIATTAPGWRTARGIGPGSSIAVLTSRYAGQLHWTKTCYLNGFGGQSNGYALASRVFGALRFTFFQASTQFAGGIIDSRTVTEVWIGLGRVPGYVPGC
ncbi:MAG: hypothetical protein ACLP8S_23665 [Solirubrobacteraceae bacterium]